MSSTDSRPGTPSVRAVPTLGGGYGWGTFAVVSAVVALTQLGFYLVVAALPLYLHDLGAAEGRIGPEIGLASVVGLLLALVVGPAINRHGSELFLRAGGALYVLSLLGMVLVPNEAAVTVMRVLQGLAAAAIIPAAFTLGSRLMPERHATALGTLGAMNSLALAAGPPIGLLLYNSHGGRGLFLPAAIISGAGLLSSLLLPRIEATHQPASGFGFDPAWWPALISNMLAAMYFGGILAYLPLELRQVHGPNAGIFFTADALGVLVLRIPTGLLADRHGSFLPKLLGVVVTLPGIAVLFLSPSIVTLALSGAATGVGAGLFITGVMGELSRLSTDGNRGTAISLGSGSFNGAVFVGSAVSGLLIGHGGFDAVLLFGLITTVAAFPFVLWRGRVVTG